MTIYPHSRLFQHNRATTVDVCHGIIPSNTEPRSVRAVTQKRQCISGMFLPPRHNRYRLADHPSTTSASRNSCCRHPKAKLRCASPKSPLRPATLHKPSSYFRERHHHHDSCASRFMLCHPGPPSRQSLKSRQKCKVSCAKATEEIRLRMYWVSILGTTQVLLFLITAQSRPAIDRETAPQEECTRISGDQTVSGMRCYCFVCPDATQLYHELEKSRACHA